MNYFNRSITKYTLQVLHHPLIILIINQENQQLHTKFLVNSYIKYSLCQKQNLISVNKCSIYIYSSEVKLHVNVASNSLYIRIYAGIFLAVVFNMMCIS